MDRTVKVIGLALCTLFATAAAAWAGSYVLKGDYTGKTDDKEPVTVVVEKDKDGKYVTEVIVDQTKSGCERTVIRKDAEIKNQRFTATKKTSSGYPIMTVSGTWVDTGKISGSVKQLACDGMTDDYVAFHDSGN